MTTTITTAIAIILCSTLSQAESQATFFQNGINKGSKENFVTIKDKRSQATAFATCAASYEILTQLPFFDDAPKKNLITTFVQLKL